MKIVFMGNPDFSAMVFEKLNNVHAVSAVVTALDKPTGRGYKLQPSALKAKADELEIPVLQFENVSKDGLSKIRELAPDVIITAAFGQILSEEFLSIPKYGVLNVHASLLPKYRGSSPIQQAILNGDKETGVTIMRTVKAVDAGDILLQRRIEIGKDETAGELFNRLAELGGDAIIEAIYLLESGKAEFTPQDGSLATYCSMISKEDGEIDFEKFNSATQFDRFVRAMSPWPSAYTYLDGKMLKILKVNIINDEEYMMYLIAGYAMHTKVQIEPDMLKENGTVINADTEDGLVIVSKGLMVRLRRIQLEGGKSMTDVEFLHGHEVKLGTVLGK